MATTDKSIAASRTPAGTCSRRTPLPIPRETRRFPQDPPGDPSRDRGGNRDAQPYGHQHENTPASTLGRASRPRRQETQNARQARPSVCRHRIDPRTPTLVSSSAQSEAGSRPAEIHFTGRNHVRLPAPGRAPVSTCAAGRLYPKVNAYGSAPGLVNVISRVRSRTPSCWRTS